MRTYEEYKRILEYWEKGYSKKGISRALNIPRRTVIDCIQRYGTIDQLEAVFAELQTPLLLSILQGEREDTQNICEAYAYILGMYLGDGNISKLRKIYRLRITLDAKYPDIIQRCSDKLKQLFSENAVGAIRHFYAGRLSYINVSLCKKDLPIFFPQHGIGKKHERPIVLEAWQQRIIDQYPLEFWRGLYHSDGSRSDNFVAGKSYPRYQFCNVSSDIIQIFIRTCDQLGLHWTTKQPHKVTKSMLVFISKRKDVEYLDNLIGKKT